MTRTFRWGDYSRWERLPAWDARGYMLHKSADHLAAASEAFHVTSWSREEIRENPEITPVPDDMHSGNRSRRVSHGAGRLRNRADPLGETVLRCSAGFPVSAGGPHLQPARPGARNRVFELRPLRLVNLQLTNPPDPTTPRLRQLLATCDQSDRGRRDRALLLFGFAGALRRSELTFLRVEDVAVVAGGLRLRIRRGKTDQAGQGAEIGLPRGKFLDTCPVRAFEAWQAMAKRKAGPLFRKISTGDRIGADLLDPDAIRRIQARRVGMAGLGHRWL